MNLAELRTATMELIDENEAAPKYWQLADVDKALNIAYDEMTDAAQWYERRVPVPLLGNTVYYDLFAHIGPAIQEMESQGYEEGFLFVSGVWNPQTKRWLIPTTVEALDSNTNWRWEGNPGEPQNFMLRGLRWLAINPSPARDGGWLDVQVTAEAPALVLDTDEPGFDEEFHTGIIDGARSDLFAQDHESKKAMKYYKRYLESTVALQAYVEKRLATSRHFISGTGQER